MDLNGVNVLYDGEQKQIETNFTSLGIAGVLIIIIIYLILFVQFKSFIQPLVIIYSLPLSLIGVIVGLLMCDMPLSLTAVMGIISLIGVVIRNAILLVEYIIEGRHEGLSIDEACIHAVSLRFRPIILSSVATITGLVPLAFSKSALFGPMSVTIIFGLASATFLTFIVVPVMYSLVNTKLEEREAKKNKVSIELETIYSKIKIKNIKYLRFIMSVFKKMEKVEEFNIKYRILIAKLIN